MLCRFAQLNADFRRCLITTLSGRQVQQTSHQLCLLYSRRLSPRAASVASQSRICCRATPSGTCDACNGRTPYVSTPWADRAGCVQGPGSARGWPAAVHRSTTSEAPDGPCSTAVAGAVGSTCATHSSHPNAGVQQQCLWQLLAPTQTPQTGPLGAHCLVPFRFFSHLCNSSVPTWWWSRN
jgi:hypothetical protein